MNKAAVIAILSALLFSLVSCSGSSSSYNGGYEQWKKDNNYDRHYDNSEIQDFVNNYGDKW